jgi:FAD:protein FMN transferase
MGLVLVKKPLFGKEVEFFLPDTDKTLTMPLIEEAYGKGVMLSKIFNFYDKKSELSLLNKKRKLEVSNELLEVIKKSLKMSKETKGAYDISFGKLFLARKKNEKEQDLYCSYKNIEIKKNVIKLNHPDIMVDLGSIAKGYIADRIAGYFKEQGVESGVVNARGDIVVFGVPQTIGIQHPRKKGELILRIMLDNWAVATSGDYNQYNKSFSKSHIINSKEAISVSVVAKTLFEAEIYSTALFVIDKKSRQQLLNRNKLIRALVIDNKLHLKYYNGFEKLMVKQ